MGCRRRGFRRCARSGLSGQLVRGGSPLARSRAGGCWNVSSLLACLQKSQTMPAPVCVRLFCLHPLEAGLLQAASMASGASGASGASVMETPLDGGPAPPWPSLHLSQVAAWLAPHDPCATPAQGPSSRALLLHPSTRTEESEPAWDPDGGGLAKKRILPRAL